MSKGDSCVSNGFSKTWQKLALGMRKLGRDIKYYWYRNSGFSQQVLEELCSMENMAEFRAVLAAASGYYLPARHLFNPDGTPKHRAEICSEATAMVERLQRDVSAKKAREHKQVLQMTYWGSTSRSYILGLLYWFYVQTGDTDKSKKINRLIHDTYYEWEDLMAGDVDYEEEVVEKELGKIVCRHCADEDMDIDELREIVLKEHPNIDALAFMDPYGQLLGPAGVCKSMALIVTTMKKRRRSECDVKPGRL